MDAGRAPQYGISKGYRTAPWQNYYSIADARWQPGSSLYSAFEFITILRNSSGHCQNSPGMIEKGIESYAVRNCDDLPWMSWLSSPISIFRPSQAIPWPGVRTKTSNKMLRKCCSAGKRRVMMMYLPLYLPTACKLPEVGALILICIVAKQC